MLTCMRGFSGSGKSYRAAQIAKETGAVIVNRDLLRLQLLGSYWTGKKEDEEHVTIAEEAQVTAFLKASVPVVIDATHLHSGYLRKWARLATRMGVEFHVEDVRATLEECYVRNASRDYKGERSVDPSVIRQQIKRWPEEKWPTVTATPFVVEPVEHVPGLRHAIIVDIDGTLARIPEGGRSPFDYSRVSEDELHEVIRDIVDMYQDDPNRDDDRAVLIVSGRDDSCFLGTQKWLFRHGIAYTELIMRPPTARDERGNKSPDYLVKYDLFNRYIRGRYTIDFVLDDRDQVVQMWRKLGLKCLQVAPGDF